MSPQILNAQKELFIEELARTGNVTAAARTAGWKYPTVAEMYRKEDPDFDLAWSDAQKQANDALVAEARRRAMEGVQEPVFFKGEIVGSITKYSDKLLEVLLKGEMPEKFGNTPAQETEQSGVLLIPRSPDTVTIEDWEADAARQQQELLARTE